MAGAPRPQGGVNITVGRQLAFMARLAAAATIVLLLACSSAQAFTITAARGDDSRAYFATDEPLLPTDTDSSVDIYERSGGALALVTIGGPSCSPGCGNGAFDVEVEGGLHLVPDGIVFSTGESLLPADTDGAVDIYRRTEGGLELVSEGDGEFDADLDSVSEDGSTIVFSTAEKLAAADTDSSVDIYERTAGTTALVSQGESFNGAFDAKWAVTPPEGSSVFFLTREPILSQDTDSSVDLYERGSGETTLISRGTAPANGAFDVGDTVMTTADGDRAVFSTSEPIFEADEDEQPDLYMRFGGTTTLVSDGSYVSLEGEFPVELDAVAPQANQVVMSSQQLLNEEDRDHTGAGCLRMALWKDDPGLAGPVRALLPTSQRSRIPPLLTGGLRHRLRQDLRAADAQMTATARRTSTNDELEDPKLPRIYEGVVGSTKLVTQGPKAVNVALDSTLRQISPDGSRVFFTTAEQLVDGDTDSSVDLYERSHASVTKLVSTGEVNGNGPFAATALGDGARPMFATSEQLVPGDEDSAPDLYERVGQHTRLLSSAKPDPTAPTITAHRPAVPLERQRSRRCAGRPTPARRSRSSATAPVEETRSGRAQSAEFAAGGLKVTVPVKDNATSVVHRAGGQRRGHRRALLRPVHLRRGLRARVDRPRQGQPRRPREPEPPGPHRDGGTGRDGPPLRRRRLRRRGRRDRARLGAGRARNRRPRRRQRDDLDLGGRDRSGGQQLTVRRVPLLHRGLHGPGHEDHRRAEQVEHQPLARVQAARDGQERFLHLPAGQGPGQSAARSSTGSNGSRSAATGSASLPSTPPGTSIPPRRPGRGGW